jgi:hypothetical protein
MSGLDFYADQIVKEEQYKDLLREVERRRLIRTIAPPRSQHLRKVVEALRQAMIRPTRGMPGLRPAKWEAKS